MNDHMQILFKEYDTLPTEIIARTNNGYQLFGIGAATGALIAWLGSHSADVTLWGLIAVAFVACAIMTRVLVRDTNVIAGRVIEIEAEINLMAGKTLLQWETRSGGAATGWLIRSKRKPVSN
jgi:hypothetical protein